MTIKQLKENYTQHLRQHLIVWLILRGGFGVLAQTNAPTTIPSYFPSHHFSIYNMSDGLPGNMIYAIAFDSNGFMWIGTNNGLARYDGQRFMSFKDLVGFSDIPQTTVSAVFADSHQCLWVRFVTKDIYCIDLRTYKVRFINRDYSEVNNSFRPQFLEDKAGDIWFNNIKGIVKWQWKDNKFSFYAFPEYPNKTVVRICKGGEDYLWAATTGGIYRFDTQKNNFEREQPLLNFDSNAKTLATDDNGKLWFSNWYSIDAGIVCYDPKQRQILYKISKHMISPDANTDTHEILPQSYGKMVWFATNSSGLIAFDTENNRFNVYNPDPKNPLSIQSEAVVCAKNDKQGNLWLGTVNSLHLLQAHRKKISLLAHHPFNTNSLISTVATNAFNLDERKMVLGTLAGVSIYDRIDKTFKNINLPLYNGNDYNNNINAIAAGENGSFWVGTWSGLFRLDKNTGRTLEYYITFSNAGDNHPESVKRRDVGAIRDLFKDKKGILWLINQNNILGRMADNRPEHVFEMVKTIVQDADDKNDVSNCFLEFDPYLYIGTENGLVQYDYSNQTFQAVPITFLGHVGNVSMTSLERSGEFLLAIVSGKPYKINLAKREATPLLKLGSEHKYLRIIQDTEGGIWLVTENGLLRTDIDGNTAVFYNSKYYLNDNTFQWSDSYRLDKDADGNLYFGGSKGFTVIQPKGMLYNAPKPDVKITSIWHNNKPIALAEAIHLSPAINLTYEQGSFSLEFSALGSTIPELNQFAYRFNNEQWVYLGNQSNVNFSKLEPGTYHLQVKAANSDGIWNEEGTRLTITIQPPWYRSWLAWLLYLGVIGFGIYQYYLYQLQRKVEQSETKRLKELDTLKTRFFANVSHELRTPLTLLLAPLSTVLKSGSLDNRNFTLIRLARQNAQGLLKLVNEILDLNKLEASKLELQEEKTVVYNLIRRIIAGFESSAEFNDIDFTFDYQSGKYLQIWLDNNKFEKILNNLLSNAFKFTKNKGNVTVTVKEVQNTLSIAVKDTGRGIHPDDLPHIFNRFYQSNQADALIEGGTGIGLSLSMELAKLLGGRLTVESILGRGSTFTFELPIKEVMGTIPTVEAEEMLREIALVTEGVDLSSIKATESSNGTKPTVLIVEDNQSLSDYLSLILTPQYTVLKAENGSVALDILNKNPTTDLILSDVMMPIMDGFQLLSHLKSSDAYCSIPVIMLTARAELQDKLKALRIGVDDYLIKPFEEEELLARIENLLKNAHVRQQIRQEGFVETNPTESANFESAPNPTESDNPLSIDDQKWLADLENVLRDNLSDYNLSTDRIADALHISRSQFYRRVRLLTGLTPIEYLQTMRFNHARMLLEQRNVSSVKAAAAAVGMRQVQNFSQHFKERFGKLPSEYLT